MEVVSHLNHQEGSWSHTLNRHEIWSLFSEALCITGLDSVLPLLLPVTPSTPGDRHFCLPLAKSESVCISSGQIDPCVSLQSEGMWDQTPVGGPVLAIPDMVLRIDFLGEVNLAGDSNQDLQSQLQCRIWHPRPKISRLWVWLISGNL